MSYILIFIAALPAILVGFFILSVVFMFMFLVWSVSPFIAICLILVPLTMIALRSGV